MPISNTGGEALLFLSPAFLVDQVVGFPDGNDAPLSCQHRQPPLQRPVVDGDHIQLLEASACNACRIRGYDALQHIQLRGYLRCALP
jgi:hypothetical protein